MGSVYHRNGIWYLRYRKGSKLIRESSKSQSKREAKEQLALVEAHIIKGGTPAHMLKCTLAELLQDLVVEYENNHKEVRRLKIAIKHFTKSFSSQPACQGS